MDGAFPEKEHTLDLESTSLNAALADARALQEGPADSQPVKRTARLLSAPLWTFHPPLWAGRKWADPKDKLPDDEESWVWTDWYETHLAGTDPNETMESTRATVGLNPGEGTSSINTGLAQVPSAQTDPLTLAVEHGVRGLAAIHASFDFNTHWRRIQNALPEDPAAVVGETKDLLEYVMKTSLHRCGQHEVDKLRFPTLTDTCLAELGLRPDTKPATPAERHARKFASTAASMIEAINKLRNDVGTGHGRADSSTQSPSDLALSPADSRLAAATGLILSAWLLHHEAHH